MSFSIGSHELSAPVVLAPMAGVTNAPFRALCRQFAPGLVYVNEMVMATPVVHGNVAIYASGSGKYSAQGSEKYFTFGGEPAASNSWQICSTTAGSEADASLTPGTGI